MTLNNRLNSITPLYVLLDKTQAKPALPESDEVPRFEAEQRALAVRFAEMQAKHSANRHRQVVSERFEMRDSFAPMSTPPKSASPSEDQSPNAKTTVAVEGVDTTASSAELGR